jgi:ATP-dependent proteinase. Serine peptidase. MEROPS family S16
LEEIPDNIKKKIKIVTVEHMDEVLKHALVRLPEPLDTTDEKGAEQKDGNKKG